MAKQYKIKMYLGSMYLNYIILKKNYFYNFYLKIIIKKY